MVIGSRVIRAAAAVDYRKGQWVSSGRADGQCGGDRRFAAGGRRARRLPRGPPAAGGRDHPPPPRGAAMNDASRPHRLYLIDGSGYIFRAFHALPPLTREDGTPINAVLGFTNMIYKLINETDADAIAVVFDAGRASFRNDLYGDYKAHRPEAPPELVPQFALIRDATRAFNLPSVELEGFEADDIIATYARHPAAARSAVTI